MSQIRDAEKGKRTENDVGPVQPRSHDSGDEKLGTIRVLAGVSHRQETRLGVLDREVLIYVPSAA